MFTLKSVLLGCWLVALLLGSSAIMPLPAKAQTDGQSPLEVQASLVSPAVFSLGEPVVLKYKITNISSEEVHTYMGLDESGWVTETVTNAQGQTTAITLDNSWRQKGGAHVNGITVSPLSSATGYISVNPASIVGAAGKYALTLHARLPYALEAQAEKVAPERYEMLGNIAVGDFQFSITVTPRDPQRLKQAAETLRVAIEDAKRQDQAAANSEALFSMPEADVLPVWQELISDPAVPKYALAVVSEQLVRLHSLTATDLAAQMRWNAPQSVQANEASIGVLALERLYQVGDAAVQKHVADLYAAHGESHLYTLE